VKNASPEKPAATKSISGQELARGSEAAIAETEERIRMVLSREQSIIDNNEQLRTSTGLFGKFHRMLTLSDPYEIEIKNSRQVMSTMNYMRQFLAQAKQETDPVQKAELINRARRVLGMRVVTPELTVSDEVPTTRQRTVRGTEHFDVEQQNIDVSRDAALDVGITAATLGGGAVANLGRKGAQVAGTEAIKQGLKYAAAQGAKEGAVTGAVFSATTSTGKNIDEVVSGRKGVGEAMQDVATDTAKGTAMGAGLGAGFGVAAKGIEKGVARIRAARGTAAEAEAAAQSGGQSSSGPRERPQARANPEQEAKANPRQTDTTPGTSEGASKGFQNPNWRPGAKWHEVLGVKPEASAQDIQEAYRALVNKYHPDKNQGSEEAKKVFQQLGNAFDEVRNAFRKKGQFL
jgi:hypothetical protein